MATSYRTEFPRFTLDLDVSPLTAAGFIDSSWHNDACPSWSFHVNEAACVQVFVAEANAEEREFPDSPRFMVQRMDDNGAPTGDFFESDDWSEAVTYALHEAVLAKHDCSMTESLEDGSCVLYASGNHVGTFPSAAAAVAFVIESNKGA